MEEMEEMEQMADSDFTTSLLLLAGLVLLSELARRWLERLLARTGLAVYAVELVSTFQLCACTHELKLLGEVGRLEPRFALTLTYLASVVHALTFRGALGNPSGALEHAYRGRLAGRCALLRIACQFLAAVAARAAARGAWSLGLSDLHRRHKLLGFRCLSPIRSPLPRAAAVELACAFAVQTAVTHTRALEEKYRVHAVAMVITCLVYAGPCHTVHSHCAAGGSVTGAVFNPALAFSIQFPCSGNSFLEYGLVYWLAPVLGMMSSVLLFDLLIPPISGKSHTEAPYRPLEGKKRK